MGTPPSPCLQFFTAPNSPMADSPAQSPAQAMDSPPPRSFMPQSPTPVPAPAPIVSPSAEAPPEEPFAVPPEPGMELSLDDDNLSVLEKIYLFSRSKATFHRVFIAHALPSFLEQISPQEAVEYVLPLLSGLAMDDEDTVKEAFAAELLAIMWYFFTKCQVVPDDPQTEDLMFPSARSAPAIPVQAFTPILGTLLLSSNGQVGLSTRYAIVTILNRIQRLNESESRKADFVPPASRPSSSRGILAKDPHEESDDDEDLPPTGLFGYEEREMFEQELLQQVVIGMGRLDQQWSNTEEGYVDIDPLAMQEDRSPNVGTQLGDQYPPEYPARSPLDEPRVRSPAEPLPEDEDGDRMPAPKPATDYFPKMPPTTPALSPPTSSPDYTPPWPTSNVSLPMPTVSAPNEQSPFGGLRQNNPEEEQAAFGRVSSMSLISAVSVSVKLSESAQQAFVTEVERVCRDPIYWVRREAAFAVGALAKVVPDEIVMTSLLPLFEGLRSDSMWHVRHSALFAFPALLARLDAQQRRRVALETVIPLSRDESAAVRTGTLEALGEAIYSFRNDDGGIPQELLELFVGRREDRRIRDHSAPDEEWVIPSDWGTPLDSFYRDPGRPLICAFNLPAVALTLGRERWGAIRELYLHLADDCTTKVRRTLAASLGALAGIIGPENARQDLMVVWWDSIRCEEQEVRGKVIEAMEAFVEALGPCTERIEVVQSVLQVWDEGMLTAWRERETVAKSLIGVTRAIGQEDPMLVRSLLMKTLEDNVAAVRETAVHSLQEIWSIFGGRRDVLEDVRKDILTLARSSSYRQRMTFIACQQTIILPTESGHPCMVADDHVWQTLLPLAQDSIVGVRIGVSRLVANYWDKYLQHTHIPDGPMLDVIRKLTSDPAHEVQTYLPARLRGVAGPLLEPKPMERSASSTARRRARDAANMSATFSKPPRAASILIPE
uniref:TOG domain-containing protein n=1 Tax=Schizophyllum commune (strain H4-8 / FGSC 9210) TaxID=578458 RepID=D8PWW9_SCHCM